MLFTFVIAAARKSGKAKAAYHLLSSRFSTSILRNIPSLWLEYG